MNIYEFFQQSDSPTIIKYIMITLLFIFIFRSKNIQLNIVIALFFSIIVIVYLHQESQSKDNIKKEVIANQINNITPQPDQFKDKLDLIDFFYSVQDFYRYSPQVYTECIYHLDDFFKTYKIIMTGNKYCNDYYKIAVDQKNKSVNSFHAIIYNLPDDSNLTDKFNRSHKRLETLLTNYLNDLYDKCQERLITHGRDVYTSIILTGPAEYNSKDNYELY